MIQNIVYFKVLLAVDTSEHSLKTAKTAFNLSSQLNTSIAIVCVLDNSKAYGNVDAGILPQDQLAELKYEADKMMKSLVTTYSAQHPIQFMPTGTPGKEIIQTAKDWDADILILGTHGRTGLKRLLMGSTAEYVLRHSPIPVFIVPMK